MAMDYKDKIRKSYISACLDGEVPLDSINDYIEYWHTHETGNELSEFLGMTTDEYSQWLKSGEDDILYSIMAARKEQDYSQQRLTTGWNPELEEITQQN